MTQNDFIKHLADILNIELKNKSTMSDMIEDLKEIYDLNTFRLFIKNRFYYERFNYLTGYQKFLALKNEFLKENEPKLTQDEELKVELWVEMFASKIWNIFNEFDWHIKNGKIKNLDDMAVFLTLQNYLVNEKELLVFNKVGGRAEIMRLFKIGGNLLKEKIKEVVTNLTLEKKYPRLTHKNDGTQTFKRLQGGLK